MNFLLNIFTTVNNTTTQIMKSVTETVANVQESLNTITNVVVDTANSVVKSVTNTLNVVVVVGAAVGNNIIETSKTVIGEISDTINTVVDAGTKVIDSIKTNTNDIKNGGDFISNLGEILADTAGSVSSSISVATKNGTDIINSLNGSLNIAIQGGQMIGNSLKLNTESLVGDLEYNLGTLEQEIGFIKDELTDLTQTVVGGITNVFDTTKDNLAGFFDSLKNIDFSSLAAKTSSKNYNAKKATLRLSLDDVIANAEENVLVINGDKGQTVDIVFGSKGFESVGVVDGYTHYKHDDIQLFIEQSVAVI